VKKMSFNDDLAEQVHAQSTPVYVDTKHDLITYYQQTYHYGWQVQLANDLAPYADASPRSIQRRFNPDRINRPGTAQEQLQYQELAAQIGPVEYEPPEGGYEVTFVGEIAISRKCYPRAFTIYITGDEATAFANNPDIMDVFTEYFEGEDVAEGFCGSPDIDVRAA